MRGAKGCEWRVFLERRLGGLNKSTADALTAVPGRFIGAVPEFSYNVWTMDLLVGLLQLPRGSRNCAESLMREWLRALLRPLKKSCRCGLRPYHGAYVTPTFSNSSLGRIEEPQDSDSSFAILSWATVLHPAELDSLASKRRMPWTSGRAQRCIPCSRPNRI